MTDITLVYGKDRQAVQNIWEEGQRRSLSRFVMPFHVATGKLITWPNGRPVTTDDLFKHLPFQAFTIVEDFDVSPLRDHDWAARHPQVSGRGQEEYVIYEPAPGKLAVATRLRLQVDGGYRMVFSTPETEERGRKKAPAWLTDDDRAIFEGQDEDAYALMKYSTDLLARFMIALYDRRHRYLETPLIRQRRRAEGRAKSFKEYTVIPREDVRYLNAGRMGDLHKRLKQLHAVSVRAHPRSGHLRHLNDGKIVTVNRAWINAHVRGEGIAMPREYHLQSSLPPTEREAIRRLDLVAALTRNRE